jgi:hypothetical protein
LSTNIIALLSFLYRNTFLWRMLPVRSDTSCLAGAATVQLRYLLLFSYALGSPGYCVSAIQQRSGHYFHHKRLSISLIKARSGKTYLQGYAFL